MELILTALTLAFFGGVVGTLMGALPNFILCSLALVIGIASHAAGAQLDITNGLAWGAFLGPHIGFAGGAAAASYARRVGVLADGKDIVTPLIGLGRADVWAVGGVFGAAGFGINTLLTPIAGNAFNSIALTIVILALLSKILFDTRNVIDRVPEEVRAAGGRFSRSTPLVWIAAARTPLQLTVLGLFVGGWSAGATKLFLSDPTAAGVATSVGFAFSVASLLFVMMGQPFPVTHHIALTAAVATALTGGDLLWGIAWGMIAAHAAHYAAQVFLVHGQTWIDPPSVAIAFSSFFITGLIATNVYAAIAPVAPVLLIAIGLAAALISEVRAKRRIGTSTPTPTVSPEPV